MMMKISFELEQMRVYDVFGGWRLSVLCVPGCPSKGHLRIYIISHTHPCFWTSTSSWFSLSRSCIATNLFSDRLLDYFFVPSPSPSSPIAFVAVD